MVVISDPALQLPRLTTLVEFLLSHLQFLLLVDWKGLPFTALQITGIRNLILYKSETQIKIKINCLI